MQWGIVLYSKMKNMFLRLFYFLLGVFFFAGLNLVFPATSVIPNSLYFALVSAEDEMTGELLNPSIRDTDLFLAFPKGLHAVLRYPFPAKDGGTLLLGVGKGGKGTEEVMIEVSGYGSKLVTFSKVSGRNSINGEEIQRILFTARAD